MKIRSITKYFVYIKENINNNEEFENELTAKTYKEALIEAKKILTAYYKSYSYCNNSINYKDLIAEVRERIVLEEMMQHEEM